jgi:hypothetical protein
MNLLVSILTPDPSYILILGIILSYLPRQKPLENLVASMVWESRKLLLLTCNPRQETQGSRLPTNRAANLMD